MTGSLGRDAQLAPPVAAIAAALATLAGCATAEPYNPGHLAPDQLARVGEICQSVLRVSPGEQHFVGCVESLSQSARSAGEVHVASSLSDASSGPVERKSSASYFAVSTAEVRRRVQLSCVRLGLDPTGVDYPSCVANLAGTMQGFDLPPLD